MAVVLLLALLAASGPDAHADEVEESIARARELMEAGDPEGAEDELIGLQKAHPNDARPLPLLAYLLYEKLDRPQMAAERLDAYLRLVPGDRYGLNLLTTIAERTLDTGKPDVSRWCSRILMEMEPNKKEHGLRWARASFRLGEDLGSVREACRALIERYPSYDEAYRMLARVYEDEGKYEEAVAVYRDLLSEHPGDLSARIILAHRFLWQLRDYDAAEDAFRSALEIADTRTWAHENAQAGLVMVEEERERSDRIGQRYTFLTVALVAVLACYAALFLLLLRLTKTRGLLEAGPT